MKKALAVIGLTGVVAGILWSALPVEAQANYLKVLGLQSSSTVALRTNSTSSGTVNGTGTFGELSVAADLTIADSTVAPTVNSELSAGSCSQSQGVHRFYVRFYNAKGGTNVTDYVAYTPSAASRRVVINIPSTIPARANAWAVYWSRQSDFTNIRACTAGTSNGAILTTTATFTCGCSTSGATPPGNTTGDLTVFGVTDSGLVFPSFLAAVPYTATAGLSRIAFPSASSGATFQGPWPTYSSDSGTTNTPFAMSPSKQICANGCEFDGQLANANGTVDFIGATYYESGTTPTNRGQIVIRPGNYQDQAGHIRPNVTVACEIPHACVFTPGVATGSCLDFIKTGDVQALVGMTFDGCWTGVWSGTFTLNLLQNNNFNGNSIYGAGLGDPTLSGNGVTGTFKMEQNFIRATKDAGFITPMANSGWTLDSRDNDFIASTAGITNSDSRVAAFYMRDQTVNSSGGTILSTGDTFQATSDQAAYTTYGIRIYPEPSGGSSRTRVVIRNPYIKVTNSHGTATGDLYGIRVEGTTANPGSTIDVYNPVIDMSSSGAAGTLYGVRVENASTNLTVTIHNPRIIQSGGATRTPMSGNVRTFAGADMNGAPSDNLVAGACTVGEIKADDTGANREFCWCWNNAGTKQWACVNATTTNGPTD